MAMNMGELRVGVVGLGMAGALMTSVIDAHPRTRLAAVAEVNPLLRERFAAARSVPVVEDVRTLVQLDGVDAVYVATPHQFHRDHAIVAAEHRKHVIVEKPMALTLHDCDAMIDAAERHGVTLIVGHTHSFGPAIARMRTLIAEGDLGRPALLAMWNYTDFLYRPRRPEELDTSLGGGILFNQVPHQLDIARFLAGARVTSVRASAWVLDARRKTEGTCTALVFFENGCATSIVYSGYNRFDSDELHGWIGEGGYIRKPAHGAAQRAWESLPDAEAEARKRTEQYGFGAPTALSNAVPEHQPHFGTIVVTCERGDLRQSADGILVYTRDGVREEQLPPVTGRPGRTEVLDELCAAVLDRVPPPHDGRFARGTVAACLAVLESSRTGREIIL